MAFAKRLESVEVLTKRSSSGGGEGNPNSTSPASCRAALSNVSGSSERAQLLTQRRVRGVQKVAKSGKLFLGHGVEKRADSQARDWVDQRVQRRDHEAFTFQRYSPGEPTNDPSAGRA